MITNWVSQRKGVLQSSLQTAKKLNNDPIHVTIFDFQPSL